MLSKQDPAEVVDFLYGKTLIDNQLLDEVLNLLISIDDGGGQWDETEEMYVRLSDAVDRYPSGKYKLSQDTNPRRRSVIVKVSDG